MSEQQRVSLTIAEYASKRKVCVKTVYRWIKAGRIPVVRYTARTIRVEYPAPQYGQLRT